MYVLQWPGQKILPSLPAITAKRTGTHGQKGHQGPTTAIGSDAEGRYNFQNGTVERTVIGQLMELVISDRSL